ncbi:class I SAM-dependent methyltransferase [Candidatus Poribacteria bacterium]
MGQMSLLRHYKNLWFYNFHRFEGNNVYRMSSYFADILIMDMEEFMLLDNKTVLDVGGSSGIYCKILAERRNCMSVNLDLSPGEYVWPRTVIGVGEHIPFPDSEFDLLICRGVLEHIPQMRQQIVLDEMCRVLRPGGFCYIVIPPWYNFHAGHGLKPFHILPFKLGRYLRKLCFGNEISADSLDEMNLYPITFRRIAKIIGESEFRIVATRDTHFRLHCLTRIPVVREIMVPAVAFIVRKNF